MTVCLRVEAGGHELLLDSASVRRVERAGMPAIERGDDLPALDLSRRLGGAALDRPGGVVIIYAAQGGGDEVVALIVDEVKGLVTLGPKALLPLPPITERFARLFDAIAVEPVDGRHPLHLRAALDIHAIEPDDA